MKVGDAGESQVCVEHLALVTGYIVPVWCGVRGFRSPGTGESFKMGYNCELVTMKVGRSDQTQANRQDQLCNLGA